MDLPKELFCGMEFHAEQSMKMVPVECTQTESMKLLVNYFVNQLRQLVILRLFRAPIIYVSQNLCRLWTPSHDTNVEMKLVYAITIMRIQ